MRYTLLPIIFSMLALVQTHGQTPELDRLTDEIKYQADVMVNADLDKHRLRAHRQFEMTIDSFLAIDGSFSASLDSVPWLSVLHGEDFRLVTWQLKVSNEEFTYGGFIQWIDRVVHFKDSKPFLNGSSTTTYTTSGWYGCLYYKLIPFESGGKKLYLLFGFHAQNSLINTKVADILDLTGTEPKLGVPLFTKPQEIWTRLMITYADVSNAHIRYDETLKAVVHDHVEVLPGVGPNGEALPVSDGSLEGWLLDQGKWIYKEEMYDVQQTEPPMTDERKERKEDKDILGRPKKE